MSATLNTAAFSLGFEEGATKPCQHGVAAKRCYLLMDANKWCFSLVVEQGLSGFPLGSKLHSRILRVCRSLREKDAGNPGFPTCVSGVAGTETFLGSDVSVTLAALSF